MNDELKAELDKLDEAGRAEVMAYLTGGGAQPQSGGGGGTGLPVDPTPPGTHPTPPGGHPN